VGRRSKYPEEFRQRAAQLVLDSRRSVRDVAGERWINHETLRNWVAAERGSEPMGRPRSVPTNGSSWPGCGARSPS
jgi:transposase-like protein